MLEELRSEIPASVVVENGETVLNMGPHHPSSHGVIRLVLTLDGEVIHTVTPDIGYLHRAIEKIAEKTTYYTFVPFTDRVDYLGAMFMNHGYAMAVEKLAGIEVPERADYLRVLADELNRIASHLIFIGSMTMDLGAYTPFVQALREREKINDIIEELCGARLTYNYIRVGGVAFDLTPNLPEKILRFLDGFEVFIEEFDKLITYNEIFVKRAVNIGIIPADKAISYGLVGPNLRASGVDYDVRRDAPYSVYSRLNFDVPVGNDKYGTVGDSFNRFLLRIAELHQSVRLIRQALKDLPSGPVMAKVPRKIKVEPGKDAFSRVESARGDTLYYIMAGANNTPHRVRVRTGSFTAVSVVSEFGRGVMLADLVAIFAGLDIVAPEIDR